MGDDMISWNGLLHSHYY